MSMCTCKHPSQAHPGMLAATCSTAMPHVHVRKTDLSHSVKTCALFCAFLSFPTTKCRLLMSARDPKTEHSICVQNPKNCAGHLPCAAHRSDCRRNPWRPRRHSYHRRPPPRLQRSLQSQPSCMRRPVQRPALSPHRPLSVHRQNEEFMQKRAGKQKAVRRQLQKTRYSRGLMAFELVRTHRSQQFRPEYDRDKSTAQYTTSQPAVCWSSQCSPYHAAPLSCRSPAAPARFLCSLCHRHSIMEPVSA